MVNTVKDMTVKGVTRFLENNCFATSMVFIEKINETLKSPEIFSFTYLTSTIKSLDNARHHNDN